MLTLIIATGMIVATILPTFGIMLNPNPKKNDTEQTLIDFSNISAANWQIVNDSVMGGITSWHIATSSRYSEGIPFEAIRS